MRRLVSKGQDMTSIAAAQARPARPSPRDELQEELRAKIASGAVSQSDGTAIDAALATIEKTLDADRAATSTSASTSTASKPRPEEMKAKIEGLIDGQVKAGSLTSSQASTLKQLFSDVAAKKPGHDGPGAPPPGEAREIGETGADVETGESEGGFSLSAPEVAHLFAAFLQGLRDQAGSVGYGTDGTATGAAASPLVLDKTA